MKSCKPNIIPYDSGMSLLHQSSVNKSKSLHQNFRKNFFTQMLTSFKLKKVTKAAQLR